MLATLSLSIKEEHKYGFCSHLSILSAPRRDLVVHKRLSSDPFILCQILLVALLKPAMARRCTDALCFL